MNKHIWEDGVFEDVFPVQNDGFPLKRAWFSGIGDVIKTRTFP